MKAEDVLRAVVRQALVLQEELTAHDVLEQIDALGRGDLIAQGRVEIEREFSLPPRRRQWSPVVGEVVLAKDPPRRKKPR
jgi:hypothetical protein